MKIAICSDIHLEFGPISLKNTKKAEVLILSGDICVAKDILNLDPHETRFNDKSSKIHLFFQECCARFKHVVYISGNHEHYHGDFAETFTVLRDRFGYLVNLHILDKESVLINDIMFIGGTLWTDFNGADLQTMQHASWGMNDYNGIKNSDSGHAHGIWKLIPEATLKDQYRMRDYIKTVLANRRAEERRDRRVVVVGHHAPSRLSTKPRYQKDVVVNGGYSSSLDDFILEHPQIRLWTHGHTHDTFDYMIGSTRIVCNPRGYAGHEEQANLWQLITVDV